MAERFTTNLQESVVTLLCMDSDYGKIAAGIVDVELFEPPFDDIVTRAIDYHRRFGAAPGSAHVDDIFDHVLSDKDNKKHKLYSNILGSILDLAEGLNAPYILSRVNDFMRAQNLKAAVIEAGQRYQQGGNNLIPDVENILHKALKFHIEPMEAGTYLGDTKRVISFINPDALQTYKLGIPELDRRNIGPTAGEMFEFMAPKGRGKTWFCIHTGRECLMQGARVLHISLEMSEERIIPRYLQSLFAIAKRSDKVQMPKLEFDELDRLAGYKLVEEKPALHFQDGRIDHKVKQRLTDFGPRLGRLLIKSFPTSSLTVGALEAYLDSLELTQKFIPNVLILDYPDLMKVPGSVDNLRLGLGELYRELRGLFKRRNLAGIIPVQSNREGEDTRLVTAKNTGEDYSKTQTADILVTYNQTSKEKQLGLARLYVDKARNDDDKFTLLITQSYATGQFCLQSAFMPNKHWDFVKRGLGEEDPE